MTRSAREILKSSKIVVSPETFFVVSVDHENFVKLLSDPDRSPRMNSEFLIFKDKWEVTLVVDSADFGNLGKAIDGASVEGNFRLLSFDAEMGFDVVGFMSAVASILAAENISILPFFSFNRDHVLVKQDDLPKALKAFRGIVSEVC
ncbi:MAG: ACT domain-containing protein [Acidobacteria bacterium]|nr:MAG: ACT domain-containing protein [Acidobacteriota bacterium]REK01382.1 MAG: ACT domain-containing protein [Acidobacteriota bacterium]REK14338.1 MAG: ACT domain-containing protein [Acidobacteriota bacterium]REK45053.1 MAG: ACT domain-containing protein [Acidobacteriota bacterium]